MGSRSPSRRSTCVNHEKGQGSTRSRGGTSSERRSESSRDFRTSPRSDKSASHGPRRSTHPINEGKRQRSETPRRERSPHRERQNSHSPERSYREKSVEEKSNGRPVFRGPDDGGEKFDIKELKRITVNIKRSLPKKEKVMIQRTITNPEAITPVRRPDEGSRPIFARPELMAGPREGSQERRRVGTRESLEKDLHHKRERSESPHSSGHDHQSNLKKRDSSSYDAKQHRTRSPVSRAHRIPVRKDSNHSSENRGHEDRHRTHDGDKSSRTSRSQHNDKGSERCRSRERERSKSNSDRHKRHSSSSPSSAKRRYRSDSWDKSKQSDRERYRREERHVREREERRSRRDLSRERYREQNESSERSSLQTVEEYVEDYSHMMGPRMFRPIRPMMIAPPMMAYRPPVHHLPPPPWMIRPGFRPPRPPPYAPPRYLPPY